MKKVRGMWGDVGPCTTVSEYKMAPYLCSANTDNIFPLLSISYWVPRHTAIGFFDSMELKFVDVDILIFLAAIFLFLSLRQRPAEHGP